ncbi:MAG TPA: protein phosphatase 2C domain-containing protein [Bryobacteraceae bacterium]|nr:protein phosphatase 2C domain-containing protein [Bryobacteraceae bacterium]
MPFLTHSISRTGGRSSNQDFFAHESRGKVECWALADGLGGHRGGDVAPRLAVQTIIDSFRREPIVSEAAVTRWLEDANAALAREQEEHPEIAGMRTTVVLLVADPSMALWAHVGDSRLYHFRAAAIHCQTKDHSVPQAMAAAGEITAAEIRFHEDRNRLLRTLGDASRLRPALSDGPEALQAGDAFLLCTDGFWELVDEADMESALAASTAPERWLAEMERRLETRLRGDDDNYSAAAIFLDTGGIA